jgi:hypothetical protein
MAKPMLYTYVHTLSADVNSLLSVAEDWLIYVRWTSRHLRDTSALVNAVLSSKQQNEHFDDPGWKVSVGQYELGRYEQRFRI